MEYSQEFLSQKNLLVKTIFSPLPTDEERAFFIGIYQKDHFASLQDFGHFTQNISSITQDWYMNNDLQEAYEFYLPDECTKDGYWIDKASITNDSLRNWISTLGSDIDLSCLEKDLVGQFYWCGDKEEFSVVGETPDYFFDAYIADC